MTNRYPSFSHNRRTYQLNIGFHEGKWVVQGPLGSVHSTVRIQTSLSTGSKKYRKNRDLQHLQHLTILPGRCIALHVVCSTWTYSLKYPLSLKCPEVRHQEAQLDHIDPFNQCPRHYFNTALLPWALALPRNGAHKFPEQTDQGCIHKIVLELLVVPQLYLLEGL